MKFCLYQGTFNPIHNAHINVGKFVHEKLNFDKVIFIPAYKPPHKNGENNNIEPIHRLNMAELATKEYPYFEVSDIEFQRDSISYTYITIKELYTLLNPKDKISFIIGTDAFSKIETWNNADKLKELIDFIVFIREDDFDESSICHLKDKGYNYTLAKLPFLDISSSEVRDRIKENQDIYDIVPKQVGDYINQNELYKY